MFIIIVLFNIFIVLSYKISDILINNRIKKYDKHTTLINSIDNINKDYTVTPKTEVLLFIFSFFLIQIIM